MRGRFPEKPPAQIVNSVGPISKRLALQPDRKIGIFIAVPTVSGKTHFTVPLMFARYMASNHVAECPFRFSFHIEPGVKGIDYARNRIVQTFMEQTDADWLVMVDEDQEMPEELWKLCLVGDADVVAAEVPVWVASMDPEAMLRVNNYGIDHEGRCYNLNAPPDEAKQPYTVPVVGTGCIAIRRRVFAPKPAGLGLNPFYFTHAENRKVLAGEDVNFSVNCQRGGFVVAAHPEVWSDHSKELPLRQVERYYRARKALEDSGKTLTDSQRLSIG